MKNLFNEISQSEKDRILEMYYDVSNRQYLTEGANLSPTDKRILDNALDTGVKKDEQTILFKKGPVQNTFVAFPDKRWNFKPELTYKVIPPPKMPNAKLLNATINANFLVEFTYGELRNTTSLVRLWMMNDPPDSYLYVRDPKTKKLKRYDGKIGKEIGYPNDESTILVVQSSASTDNINDIVEELKKNNYQRMTKGIPLFPDIAISLELQSVKS